jgi:hypothetical protein
MKNIFKFMGVALVAGCLVFAACKKDDNDSEGTTPTPQPQPSTPTLTVKFGSTDQYNGIGQAVVNQGYVISRIYKEVGSLPYTDICFNGSATGALQASQVTTIVNEGTDSAYVSPTAQYDNENIGFIEYGENTQIPLSGNYYGDWLMKEGTLTVTSFDATSLTGTMTLNAQMFDFLGWLQGYYEYDEADVRTLIVNCSNYQFASMQQ